MDNEEPIMGSGLPKATGFPAHPDETSKAPHAPTDGTPSVALSSTPAAPTANDGTDRNGVFRHLVKDDSDIAGLVAYSIYKQNKLDWLTAFEAAKGRGPDDAELASYIIGEGTPRRLATYRHLAEATLAGNGPDVDGTGGTGRAPARRRANAPSPLAPALVAVYALVAVLFMIGFWLAAHFTMASR